MEALRREFVGYFTIRKKKFEKKNRRGKRCILPEKRN